MRQMRCFHLAVETIHHCQASGNKLDKAASNDRLFIVALHDAAAF